MIPFESEHAVEYSMLAAAWGVRVGLTLPGLRVVGLAGWHELAGGLPADFLSMAGIGHRLSPHTREKPILHKFATVVLGGHLLARL